MSQETPQADEQADAQEEGRWILYVLRCADDTLYTGITTDAERRLREHNETSRGARYTRARRPVRMVASWRFPDRSSASKAEWAFKRLSRAAKLRRLRADRPFEGD